MEGFKVCVFMVSFLKQYQCDNIPNWSPNFVVVLFRFLPHFQASSALDDVTIPRKHAALIAGRDYDEGSFGADDKVGIQGHVRVIHKVNAKGSAAIFSWSSRLWLGAKEVARWNLVSIWRNIRKMNRTGVRIITGHRKVRMLWHIKRNWKFFVIFKMPDDFF